MKDDHGFSSLTEFFRAVKRAEDTGEIDPRLKPVDPPPAAGFTDEELARLEQLADELDPPPEGTK